MKTARISHCCGSRLHMRGRYLAFCRTCCISSPCQPPPCCCCCLTTCLTASHRHRSSKFSRVWQHCRRCCSCCPCCGYMFKSNGLIWDKYCWQCLSCCCCSWILCWHLRDCPPWPRLSSSSTTVVVMVVRWAVAASIAKRATSKITARTVSFAILFLSALITVVLKCLRSRMGASGRSWRMTGFYRSVRPLHVRYVEQIGRIEGDGEMRRIGSVALWWGVDQIFDSRLHVDVLANVPWNCICEHAFCFMWSSNEVPFLMNSFPTTPLSSWLY